MAKYVNVRVKKAGGGHRMQRAIVLASGKYKFVSNRGRSTRRRRKGHKTVAKRRSRALTRRRSYVGRPRRRYHRRRRGRGGGMRPLPFALAAAGIAYLAGPSGPQPVKDLVAKIPGGKTFGATATLGIACLAIDRFVKPNKWLKLAGYAGIAAAAMRVGEKGTNFQWVGDADYSYINDDYDIDDLGDVGQDEDDEG